MNASSYTQNERRIAIETPLGDDVLLLESFSGHEEMSRLYSYDLKLLSERDDIKPEEIVGKKVTFWVEYKDGKDRYFNGHINRFSYLGTGDRLSMYRAQVVPSLWFLTRTSDCRIFQHQSVPDIAHTVLSNSGQEFKISITGNYPPWEYCVQYRETHFNFLSRLLEHEGLFYFFKHDKGKHTLVLGDNTKVYADAKENEVHMRETASAANPLDEIISWEHQYEYRSGKWSQTDYNFETPSNSLLVQASSKIKLENNDKLEFFDFPGEYEKKNDGDTDVRVRMEEEEAAYNVVAGASHCRSFNPGAKFKLKDHNAASEKDKGYVVTSVSHSASGGGSFVSGGTGTNAYSNSFTCIPDNVTFRPARLTPKPMIHGVQTALVVGPKGEEIYTDKYGRIKVQFYWDRKGKQDEHSSCFMRVAQMSAGKGWGGMAIPRIGQEVVVTYLEGDPDRPLVTGVVYNAEQMPHYTLPDEKTKTYFKTNSTLGGNGYNEIRLEDKHQQEQIFIHAQRNMDTRVLQDSMTNVLANQHLTVGHERDGQAGDQTEKIWRDKHVQVLRDNVQQTEGNYYQKIGFGGAQNGGTANLSVEKDQFQSIGKDQHSTVAMNRIESIGNSLTLTVGQNLSEFVGQNHSLSASQQISLQAGMTLVLEAGSQISLSAGGSFIDIGPSGVSIMGATVLINSGGSVASSPSSSSTSATAPQQIQANDPTAADNSKTGHKSSKS